MKNTLLHRVLSVRQTSFKFLTRSITLLMLLAFGSSSLWATDYKDVVYTFGTTIPSGWTVNASTTAASGYLKLKSGETISTTAANLFGTEHLCSKCSVEVSCGTFGTWKGTKSVTVKVDLLNQSQTVLSTASATFSSLTSSEGAYKSAIIVDLPDDPSKIATLKITYTIPNSADVLRAKYVRLNYSTAGSSKYTVTLSRNGVEEQVKDVTGEYTLPTTGEADACTDWKFKGWSESTVTSTTTAPSYITKVSSEKTVYAVYGKTESSGGGTTSYSKVTTVAGIVAGTYAIAVNKVNSSKYNFANGSAASGHAGVEGTGVTTADSYTSLPTGAKEYELSGNNTDGFTIKETSSKTYLVGTESKASLSYSSTASEKWTFALSGQGFHLTGKQGSKMSCNSTTAASAIRNYASSGSFYDPIYFFIKSTGGSTTTYTTSPNCVTKKVSSISVKTPPTTTTYTEGDSFDPAGMVIHVVYDDASEEDITSGFTVTPDPLTKTTTKVTISYGGKTTTQAVTVEEKVVEEYVLITSVDDLEAGVRYLIGNGTSDACKFVSTAESANNRKTTSGTVTNSKVEKTEAMMALELGGSSGAWTFKTIDYEGTAGYLNATSTTSSNYLQVKADKDNYSNFSISFSSNAAVITCTGKSSRNIMRANGDIISCYTSGMSPVYLYKENSTKPRVSVSPASLTAAKPNTGSDQVTATAKNFAGTVTYSWTTSDDNVATVSPTTGATTTVTYKNSGTCTITVTATDGTTTKTATVSVTVPQVYKVTWDVNGSTTDQYYLLTESPIMPATPEENCGTKIFVGWTNAPIPIEQSVAPIALYTSQSDFTSLKTAATYYAVFADESETSNTYSLIGDEEDLTSDDYVINASYGSNDYALGTNIDASGKIPGTVVTDNKGKITLISGQESLVWTITRNEDNELTFKNKATNQYLNIVSSGSYGKLELGNLGDASKYTFTNKTHGSDYADSWIFKSENISGQQLEHYQGKFQAYNSQAEDIYLYKKVLSYTAFTTVCGPTIRVDEYKYIVSGKDITIKSANIPVSGNNLESATTLSVTRTSGSANLSATLNNPTVSGGVTTDASLVISYHPTAFNTTETATFEIKDNLNQTSALFEITGISLPEKFVIASKVDDQWYSLPGNMDLFAPYSGVPTTMDNADNPTRVAVVDPIAAYSVMALTNSADFNDRLIHLSSINTGILCVSTTSSETGIRNYANTHANKLTAVSRWTIATLDGVSYTITSASKSSPLRYNRSGNKLWGMYASGAETFRIIPITNLTDECVYLREPMALKAVALASTATLTFKKIPGATNYEYSLNNGSSWADVASFEVNASDKNYIDAVVDGLMSSTSYTILLRAKSVTDVCATPVAASVSIKTTACDDTPLLGGEASTTTTTATISWTCRAATSDIVFYTDDTYSVEATTPAKITGVSSPYTITGLTKNTTYYYKVFAGGTCESVGSSFLTATPEVEVVNWNPDYIDLDLNIDGTPAAIIQKQVTEGTGEDVYADDIFFSKYFEAKGSLKLIGIYNGTAAPVSLDDVIITFVKVAENSGSSKGNNIEWAKSNLQQTLNLSPLGEIPAKTEYIFYTVTSSESDIAACIQGAVGWDKDNWFPTNNGSATIISPLIGKDVECPFNGSPNQSGGMSLTFNGTHAVSMWRGTNMIDLIGHGTTSGASGEHVQKAPKGCVKIGGEMRCDVPLNDDSGWFCEDGIDYETKDSSALSTNRFLLIRKNIVRAGYSTPAQIESMTTHGVGTESAVSSNGDNFNTLCTEWEGRAIGKFSDSEEDVITTCENFNLVSDFNYSNYYTSFKTIGDTTLLDDHNQNPDGTFRLHLEDLDSLSCQPLKIKVFNGKGGEVMFEREYTVPIMIITNSTTNSDYFALWNEGNPNSKPTPRTEEECKKCNVVVLNNVTLTKDSKVPEVHDITVYPGAQLIVPNGQTLKANTITFRRDNDEVPSAYLYNNSSLNLSATTEVYFNFRLDAKNWYWLTLPYACNVNDVTFSSGYKATYGIDWFLKYYDGEIRAANRSGGWQLVPAGTTLEPGVGYIIGIADDPNPDYKAELRFPMAQYSEQGTKNVGVRNWGENKADPADYNNIQSNELTPNNKGWQLVGNPFFAFNQNTLSGQDILKGSLSQVSLEPNGHTYQRSGTNRYITITNDHGSSYSQVLASSKKLAPFTSYFVQVGVGSGAATPVADYSLAFNATERTQDKAATAPARRMLMHAEDEMDNMNTDEPVFVGLSIVAPNGEQDETALAINDQYELDKYEMGYDLAKWKGDSYTRLKKTLIYTMAGTNERSFNAMARKESEQMIPVGFYAYNTDAYTVQFNPTYTEYLGSIEELTLYDAVMNTYTDLLKYDYTFVPNKKGDCKDRLFIIAKIAERIDVQTGMGKASILTDEICKFITPDGQLHVARKGVIYDAQGRIERVIR